MQKIGGWCSILRVERGYRQALRGGIGRPAVHGHAQTAKENSVNGAYRDRDSSGDVLYTGLIVVMVIGVFVLLVIMILRWREEASFGKDYRPSPSAVEEPR